MGRAAREWVIENHSWEGIVNALEDAYDRAGAPDPPRQ